MTFQNTTDARFFYLQIPARKFVYDGAAALQDTSFKSTQGWIDLFTGFSLGLLMTSRFIDRHEEEQRVLKNAEGASLDELLMAKQFTDNENIGNAQVVRAIALKGHYSQLEPAEVPVES